MKFANTLAASVTYKLIIAVGLMILYAPLFAAPVTFDANGDWAPNPPADIPPFATSYTASITFDNGGTSAVSQVFTQADFVSIRIVSGTVDRTYSSSSTITWYSDFASDATGMLNDGYAYFQTGSHDSMFNLGFDPANFDLRLSPNTTQEYASAYPVTFTNDEVPPATYSVGGTVSGLTGTGLALQNNGADTLAVAADGLFAFVTELESGVAYAVTVSTQPTGQTCEVTNGSGTIAAADVADVGVACVDDVVPPIDPPAPAAPIPTLSQWALIMLSMLLGLMVFANRRRLF